MEGSISEIRDAMKKKRIVYLDTYETSDQGTFSRLRTGAGFECYAGELPWRDNAHTFSCIKGGDHECAMVISNRFGAVYGVKAEGRDHVLIHKGNSCGDVNKKLKADIEGCILLGRAVGEIGGQKALLSSRDAFEAFMAEMGGEDFILRIDRGDLIKEAA